MESDTSTNSRETKKQMLPKKHTNKKIHIKNQLHTRRETQRNRNNAICTRYIRKIKKNRQLILYQNDIQIEYYTTKQTRQDQAVKLIITRIKENYKCTKRYIGEMGRPLQTRTHEHHWNIENWELQKSKISARSWGEKHRFQWDKTSIINKEENAGIKKPKESAIIDFVDLIFSNLSLP